MKNELSGAISKFSSEFIQIGEGIISEINENPEIQKGDSMEYQVLLLLKKKSG